MISIGKRVDVHMNIGAVIAAAGMSSRMHDLKQLVKIDGLTMAERIVVNFRRAGVKDIVMVTGYQGKNWRRSCIIWELRF